MQLKHATEQCLIATRDCHMYVSMKQTTCNTLTTHVLVYHLHVVYMLCTCCVHVDVTTVCVYMCIYCKHCGWTNEVVSTGRDVCCKVVITKV